MTVLVKSDLGVTLVGGGALCKTRLEQALTLAPTLVAADGGGNALADLGHSPAAIIGDMDSLRPDLMQRWAERLHPVAEQDSTDFDKCLRSIDAPFVLALGFDGARVDHTLAAMTALVRHGRSHVLLLGAEDVCFLAPPRIELCLPVGARVSLFPMGPVTGQSVGLEWPIDGLSFAPGGIIGTSNRANAPDVCVQVSRPSMLMILEVAHVTTVLAALRSCPAWPM